MPFQINTTSPPTGCAPGGRSGRIERPEPSGKDGNGLPCGIIGRPTITLHFDNLSLDGWAWYVAFTGINTYGIITSLQVWDSYKSGGPGWTTFTEGIMHRPTFETYEYGAYRNVDILFTELVENES